jgi:hypothetical protein
MFVISRFHYSTKFNLLQLAMFVFEFGDWFQSSDIWPGDITGQFFLSVLDFLPQTPTPGLGISLATAIYLS